MRNDFFWSSKLCLLNETGPWISAHVKGSGWSVSCVCCSQKEGRVRSICILALKGCYSHAWNITKLCIQMKRTSRTYLRSSVHNCVAFGRIITTICWLGVWIWHQMRYDFGRKNRACLHGSQIIIKFGIPKKTSKFRDLEQIASRSKPWSCVHWILHSFFNAFWYWSIYFCVWQKSSLCGPEPSSRGFRPDRGKHPRGKTEQQHPHQHETLQHEVPGPIAARGRPEAGLHPRRIFLCQQQSLEWRRLRTRGK